MDKYFFFDHEIFFYSFVLLVLQQSTRTCVNYTFSGQGDDEDKVGSNQHLCSLLTAKKITHIT